MIVPTLRVVTLRLTLRLNGTRSVLQGIPTLERGNDQNDENDQNDQNVAKLRHLPQDWRQTHIYGTPLFLWETPEVTTAAKRIGVEPYSSYPRFGASQRSVTRIS